MTCAAGFIRETQPASLASSGSPGLVGKRGLAKAEDGAAGAVEQCSCAKKHTPTLSSFSRLCSTGIQAIALSITALAPRPRLPSPRGLCSLVDPQQRQFAIQVTHRRHRIIQITKDPRHGRRAARPFRRAAGRRGAERGQEGPGGGQEGQGLQSATTPLQQQSRSIARHTPHTRTRVPLNAELGY